MTAPVGILACRACACVAECVSAPLVDGEEDSAESDSLIEVCATSVQSFGRMSCISACLTGFSSCSQEESGEDVADDGESDAVSRLVVSGSSALPPATDAPAPQDAPLNASELAPEDSCDKDVDELLKEV